MRTSTSNSTSGRPHSSNSTRSCMPPSTLPSILQKRHTPKQHLHQHPKLHQTAPPAPCRQSRKNAPAPSPALPKQHLRQHPKLHAQKHPVNLAKLRPNRHLHRKQLPKHHTPITSAPPTARPLAPSRQSRKSLSPLYEKLEPL